MNMKKTGGIILTAVGAVMFLYNAGFIYSLDWSIVWPVILMVIGLALSCRKRHHGSCGGCGSCGTGDHKCEGGTCKVCK